ncbi:MAG: hypothetical protein JRG92_02995 [Deltaproteobacteria bacterium]|jgi:nitrate/TMAO reductase-like tetraheme cytochrome c subunit|nr:hypothetical protein [Deltaproteobacteria bacterium]MBW2382570.1 hypothetical protein [Deltaproteobacteria bacterium]
MCIQLKPRHAAIAALGAVIAGPVGWVASDAIERNNDTCTACHIDDMPLHLDIRRDFDGRPPASLSALHAQRASEQRSEDPVMRCIDCHGGVSFAGKLRVKYLALRDSVIWLAGRGQEPTQMDFPLWDEDCSQCHAEYHPRVDEYGPPPYHALSVHNTGTGSTCVDCHRAHDRSVDADYHFLNVQHVQSRCARCHTEFERPGEI